MLKSKKLIMLVVLMLAIVVMTGCSEDEIIKTIEGDGIAIKNIKKPNAVLVNEGEVVNPEEKFSVSTTLDNPTYQWILEDDTLGEFDNPTSDTTLLIPTEAGLTAGEARFKVQVGDVTYDEWLIVDFFRATKNVTTYGNEQKDGFYSIVPTQDNNYEGYLAAGYLGITDETQDKGYYNQGYAVKADERGVGVWEKQLGDEGFDARFYAVQDVVYSMGADKYYLIGYKGITGDKYEGYIAKLNRKGTIEEEFTAEGQKVYVRAGIAVKEEGNLKENKVVMVGNDDRRDIGGVVNGYIAKVDLENGTSEAKLLTPNDNYTRFTGIEETDNGYIITGFTDWSANRNGIVMTIDAALTESSMSVKNHGYELYSIEDFDADKTNYLVAGSKQVDGFNKGYLAKVAANGELVDSFEFTYDGVTEFRSIEAIGDRKSDGTFSNITGYLLVGMVKINEDETEGVVIKIDKDGIVDTTFDNEEVAEAERDGIAKFGNHLHDISKSSEEDYYFLAGSKTDANDNQDAYVVKIDLQGNIAYRVSQ